MFEDATRPRPEPGGECSSSAASRHCMGTAVCGSVDRLCDAQGCHQAVERIAAHHRICILGAQTYEFDTGGYSLLIGLTESHISIHTWPERLAVQLDVFLCNYTRDNSGTCSEVFNEILEWFNPIETSVDVCERP